MAKALSLMIVFFLSLNAFAGMMVTSGVGADIGLSGQLQTGGDQAAQQAQDESQEISTGAPTGSTLFGLYNVLGGTLGDLAVIVFGGPAMLNNLGVPNPITGLLATIISVVYAIGLMQFLRGFSI